ncbi:hypothetical protein PISMIDRAFT_683563 [Pisolithus microcarpus 441]|uniref:Uncharacterized protein n=1 Tax=Pisolithus microcarpus 441 TaxID=765257 RepID=A0A0C9Y2V9_9AGAM|nr:hypothetical protein PISMIDRAFT_683563 [Pisolithus microcarpus 441]
MFGAQATLQITTTFYTCSTLSWAPITVQSKGWERHKISNSTFHLDMIKRGTMTPNSQGYLYNNTAVITDDELTIATKGE